MLTEILVFQLFFVRAWLRTATRWVLSALIVSWCQSSTGVTTPGPLCTGPHMGWFLTLVGIGSCCDYGWDVSGCQRVYFRTLDVSAHFGLGRFFLFALFLFFPVAGFLLPAGILLQSCDLLPHELVAFGGWLFFVNFFGGNVFFVWSRWHVLFTTFTSITTFQSHITVHAQLFLLVSRCFCWCSIASVAALL